ncbi:MAG: sulfatase [Myxococcota bacterium]
MTLRVRLLWCLLVALVGVGCAPPATPDVLLLVVGTLRADRLGSYGHHPPGRGVVALAEDGVVFENAVAPSSQTEPALASLFTSLLPSAHGVTTADASLPPEPPTLAEAFAAAGWETVAVSASSAFADPSRGLSRGFERVATLPQTPQEQSRAQAGSAVLVRDRTITKRAIEVLAEERTRPLFLMVHWMAPHPGYDARGRFKRMGQRNFSGPVDGSLDQLMQLSRGEMQLDAVDLAHLRALYEAEVWSADAQVQGLVEHLGRIDALDRAVVAVVSDHGESLGEGGRFGHGTTLHREVLHVPLVVRRPGGGDDGARVATAVGVVDVGPTLLALAGLDDVRVTAGRSLVPLLGGAAPDDPQRPIVSELHPDPAIAAAWGAQRHRAAVTTDRFSLLVGSDGSAALYEASDPKQERDLAAERPETVARLSAALD